MSALSETSLTSMKATFPAAPDPIDLMLHICHYSQTQQKTPASTTMNMFFLCRVTRSLLFLHEQCIPYRLFSIPG